MNHFLTAEGPVGIDLWAIKQLTGMPITGTLYEEWILPDLLKDATDGKGNYMLPLCFRYLMKIWRGLASKREQYRAYEAVSDTDDKSKGRTAEGTEGESGSQAEGEASTSYAASTKGQGGRKKALGLNEATPTNLEFMQHR